MSLEEVVSRLAAHTAVTGLMTIGSTRGDSFTAVSDYDLVVVLQDMPFPLHVGLTYIDERLTDLLFVRVESIDEICRDETQPVDPNQWQGRIIRWLQQGEIVFDRSGQLAATQERVRKSEVLLPISDGAKRSAWFASYYNLLQTQRLLASSDPLHEMTIDLRLLFSLYQLWTNYFVVRDVLWEGDKAAIRFLEAHDPAFLRQFRGCLGESNRGEKVRQYGQLVDLAMAPTGVRWNAGETSVLLDATGEDGGTEEMLAYWEQLLSERSDT